MFDFTINRGKIKNLYEIRYDNTSIDKLLIQIKKTIHDGLGAISVRGLDTGKNDFYFKQNPYTFKQVALYWESKELRNVTIRQYYIKLFLNYPTPLRICNMDWIKGYDNTLQTGTEEDFNLNTKFAYDLLEDVLKESAQTFTISTFCGYIPSSLWNARCYIKIIIDLPVTSHDLFYHGGRANLTDFGKDHFNEIKDEFRRIVEKANSNIEYLFNNKSNVLDITREAENTVRKSYDLRNVGDSYVNESLLATLITRIYPDTIRQYRAKWLGKYILDIYIPSRMISIEYQGEQHYMPIKRFGGDEKLIHQKERDENVRQLCIKNGVILLEWPYYNKITNQSVRDFLKPYINGE
jgi:hypothetical protein